jgi:formate C-acetyltransferase
VSSRRPVSAGSTASSTRWRRGPRTSSTSTHADAAAFRERILPYWQGKTLEDTLRAEDGPLLDAISRVVKINQKDHAQGHICPDTAKWIRLGPAGIRAEAAMRAASATPDQREFYDAVLVVLEASMDFMHRYANLATDMAVVAETPERVANLHEVARICNKLSASGAETFHEAVQSLWFLFTLLHMESNASSFSPGRADQYLYPTTGRTSTPAGWTGVPRAHRALWLKFNQIVYFGTRTARRTSPASDRLQRRLRGRDEAGRDESNELSYLFLEAQSHILLPQPNLSARLHEGTPDALLDECTRVIGLGSGMPQVFNDESIIPALEAQGISPADAINYAIVGCVELTTHGNNLGWSTPRCSTWSRRSSSP